MKQLDKRLSPRLILSVLAIGLLGFSDIMLETALNVSFPQLMVEFNVTSSTVQWLTSGVILLTSMVVILSPWLKKRFTNRSQFMVATIISIIGVLIDALSGDFGFTLFGRLLQGIGGGVGLPLMYNVIFEQVPESKRGSMVGLGSLIISFAPALGPAFGGYLTQNFGWHTVFWVVLPVQIGSLILGWFTIRQVSNLTKERLDVIGWLLLSAFFVAGIFVIERISTHGIANTMSIVLLMIMFGGIAGYLAYARVAENPLLNLDIFKFSVFSLSIVASFIIQVVNLTFNYAVPMILQIVLLKNSQVAGLALLPGAIGYALMAIISGRMYDRYGAKLPLTIGLMLMITGTILMSTVPISLYGMTISFMVIQLGAGFWFGNNMTHAVSRVPVHYQSAGNSIFAATNNYSAAVGIALAAGIIATFQNNTSTIGHLVSATRLGAIWLFRTDVILIGLATFLSIRALLIVKKKR
ncbi:MULTISPECIES: MFS transporter [Leuconostoc]|uniref:Transport protein n=2 Tax=Leuconostoc kimchii TaxID=136609 RepID=D5T300_LEUKI|nr:MULTISPECIES: MFS transporter [Leuconostoc]ADG40649.1 transport protein [Leuconostoc kimchii IMSNU 11154]AEJ31370.1 transport protein [Leuconostoc sp. C2]QBR47106.1 MFS transporter [Leuconostoc kimchii]